MNLHAIVASNVGAVNPFEPITIQTSTGNTVNADFSRSPSYAAPVSTYGDVQALTEQDLRQLEGLNIQGATRKVYMNGIVSGVVRVTQQGGDLLTLQDGTVWLTRHVLEQWDTGWCCIAIQLQNGA